MKKPIYFLTFLSFFLSISITSAQCPAGNITLTTQAEVDAFAATYPGCADLLGSLTIGPSTDIVDLNGLTNLDEITNSLAITGNDNLIDMSGLNGLTSIGTALYILDNPNITALPPFASLTNINSGHIEIIRNDLLTSIDLSSVSAPNLVSVRVDRNDVLTSLALPPDITTLSTFLSIQLNPLLNSVSQFDNLISIGDGLNLSHIMEATLPDFPVLTSIGKGLWIVGNPNITALPDFPVLISIGIGLYILDNPNITALSPFASLSNINGGSIDISRNDLLTSIDLSSASAPNLVSVEVRSNDALTSLALPPDITTLSNSLNIQLNPLLNSVSQFDNLISIGTRLALTHIIEATLPDFPVLTTIGTALYVHDNPNITALPSFANLSNINVGPIDISRNDLLTSIDLSSVSAPNPFDESTRLNFTLNKDEKFSLIIFDINGKQVKVLVDEVLDSGDHQIAWNARDESGNLVPGGIYYFRIQAGIRVETRSIVRVH
jgi:hypothetical protein